jgi:PAS domain S-box-containing protein
MGTRLAASSRTWLVATVAFVFGGCFLGARADVLLQFSGLRAAIIFAPYAVVTAALLRTPVRRWWIVLLAASAADFFPHRGGGSSVPFVLLAEVVNHLRAVLAAVCLRRYGSRRGRLETMREMVAYLVFAVFLVPAFAGLGGAALVARFGSADDFWPAWQQWSLSNAVTGLTLLPLLTVDFRRLGTGFRVSGRRAAEAGLLAGGLLLVGVGVLAGAQDRFGTHPVHFYWALPFLLWAAVRFGPRATTAALLGMALVSVWGEITQRGPFVTQSPTRGLIELELFLLAVAVPVLLLSVLFTQQRRTAAALDEIRRQYQSVVEDQTEMICRFRPDGRYTFANRAYGEAFGRPPVDLIGGNVWELVPDGVHRSRAQLAGMTLASPVITRELNVAPEGASARWQQWRERALFDEHGALVEYQMVGQDITDRKLAEEEGRKLAAQRSVEAALREADRRKDEFLAMLGHELRNPLAPIGTSLEILRLAPPEGPEAAWARDAIGRQLRHMTRLLDDLLDISRITLGRIRLKLETIDLGRVVANAVEAARPLVDAFGHQLLVRLPEAPVPMRGDTVRLTQVVANLLNNAAKYTERGGRIEVAVGRDGERVRLTVRDNGIGVAPGELERIFDLFSQMPSGRERAQGGLGIGLTLVKRLVELHEGTIEARSDGPKLGMEMVVQLPAAADEPTATIHTPLPVLVPGSGSGSLRILAVDDNVDLAISLASVLGMWGHTVRTAHDGSAALEVASVFSPEVVLLDLGLPELDGLEVARRLCLKGRPAALLVSMSGFGQEQTRHRSDEAGFHHHLVKPVDLDRLRGLLEDWARTGDRAATPAALLPSG